MSDDEILGVRDPANCKAFSEVDRAVIAMADEPNDNSGSPNFSGNKMDCAIDWDGWLRLCLVIQF